MKAAVYHDFAFNEGGGVSVCRSAAGALDADEFVGYAPDGVYEEADRIFDLPSTNPTFRNVYQMVRGQRVPELEEYDVVFQSGCATDWYVPPEDQTLIRYVHSPANCYFESGLMPLVSRALRSHTWEFPEFIFCNSERTQEETRQCTSRTTEVLYPPIDTANYSNDDSEGFLLILSRLTEGKGVLSFIESVDYDVVVCGDGPLASQVEESDADYRGWVPDEDKYELLSKCEGVVMPSGVESFGVVAAEAMASGKPVYAKEGGALDYIVEDGVTGMIYESESEIELLDTDPETVQDRAERFDIGKFESKINDILDGRD
jgi:glycosyltransferase involved in cell wall biosynthesis